MRVGYSYVRFSSEKQRQGDSLRRQVEATEAYCKTNNIELNTTLSFRDLAVSARQGANLDGGLGEFLVACEQGVINQNSVLIIENLDRISRQSPKDAMRLLQNILKYVDVYTLMDGKLYTEDTYDMLDIITSVVIMQRAYDESQTKVKRVSAAYERKRKLVKAGGYITTSQGPFWLQLSEDKTKWLLKDDKVKVVRDMFKMAVAGHGTYKIMTYLNENKIKAARGGAWSLSSTQRILTNPQVIGTFSTKKAGEIVDTIENYYPAIISERDFNAVQALRVKRSKGSAGPTSKGFKNLFRGIARCHCGSAMHYVAKGSNWNYLVCSGAVRGTGCEYKSYRYEETERFLITLLSCLNYDKLNDDNNSDLQHELNGLEVSKGGLELKIKQLGEALELSSSHLPTIVDMLEVRTGELEEVAAKIKLISIKLKPTDVTSSQGLIDMKEVLVSNNTDKRLKVHLFLANYVDVVEFNLSKVLISFKTTTVRFTADLTKPVNPLDFAALYMNDDLEGIAGGTIFDRDGEGHCGQKREWEQFLQNG